MSRRAHIAIAGGGPVGTAAALALVGSGAEVTLFEAPVAPATDPRALALSHGSRMIMEQLGAWSRLDPHTAIDSIHVSQSGVAGRVVMSAGEAGVPALGYVTPYGALARALADTTRGSKARRLSGTRVTGTAAESDGIRIEYQQDGAMHTLSADALVLADGGQSMIADVRVRSRDYHQCALVCEVHTDRMHEHRAFERFTPEGPVALLPSGIGYALVWTMTPEHAQLMCDADDDEFRAALQTAFGARAGRFIRAGRRSTIALGLRQAREAPHGRIALLGNAAQTLHPVAGQGFNLGLRDAWEFARTLAAHGMRSEGVARTLDAFRRERQFDRRASVAFTDTLARVFSTKAAPVRGLLGMGLMALDQCSPARRLLARSQIFGFGIAMGVRR